MINLAVMRFTFARLCIHVAIRLLPIRQTVVEDQLYWADDYLRRVLASRKSRSRSGKDGAA